MPHRVSTFRPPWLARRRERRANAAGRGYGSQAWQRVRLAVIARDKGICRACGLLAKNPHIDHIVEKPVDEAAEATPIEGLQLLCASCHSKKTAGRPA